jgi:hypothetical protein
MKDLHVAPHEGSIGQLFILRNRGAKTSTLFKKLKMGRNPSWENGSYPKDHHPGVLNRVEQIAGKTEPYAKGALNPFVRKRQEP